MPGRISPNATTRTGSNTRSPGSIGTARCGSATARSTCSRYLMKSKYSRPRRGSTEMAEFTLPANSKIGTGKTHAAPADPKRLRRFHIYRWNPDDGKTPVVDTYPVDLA